MNDVTILINRITDIAKKVLDTYILPISGALVVILIIWAGIKYITGGPKGEESAKKTLTAIFIGIAIIALASVIVVIVKNFFVSL
ncbi:MAG: TrbC/VirB2 family protein [Patescibacteria group bacterium]